jgi:hypothetical protein
MPRRWRRRRWLTAAAAAPAPVRAPGDPSSDSGGVCVGVRRPLGAVGARPAAAGTSPRGPACRAPYLSAQPPVSLALLPLCRYELTGQNWELTAAAGEFIRIQELGLGTNWTYWDARIGRLATIGGGGFWSADSGQFQDNWGQDKTSPHAYDAFGDAYTTFLVDQGYAGSTGPYRYGDYLTEIVRRAAWTHALFQVSVRRVAGAGGGCAARRRFQA